MEAHDLTCQFYDLADVGRPKAEALHEHILRINPQAPVTALHAGVSQRNAVQLVGADSVVDTIDVVDPAAILALHQAARLKARWVLMALSLGFGAGVLHFPADSEVSLAQVVANDMQAARALDNGKADYAELFGRMIGRIGARLDAEVAGQASGALTAAHEGRPFAGS